MSTYAFFFFVANAVVLSRVVRGHWSMCWLGKSWSVITKKQFFSHFPFSLCDKVCQWLASGRWFTPGTPLSSTNKTGRHDITEILLTVALNIITITHMTVKCIWLFIIITIYYVLEIVILIKTNPYSILLQYRRYVLRRYCAMQIDNNISLSKLKSLLSSLISVEKTCNCNTNTPRSVNRNVGLITVYEWSWNRKQKWRGPSSTTKPHLDHH